MSDNNIVSVKLGDKVLSINEDGEHWDDVTATYPYIGGTLQTEFQYEDGGSPKPPDGTGGYFISDDNRIWSLERWNGDSNIYASPLEASWDESKHSLPLYFNVYVSPIICSDYGLQHPLTEFPHEGDTFYYLDIDVHTVANATLYSTMTAGSTATDTPPVLTYSKPLIYNRDLDCIEKSLGNIEVVGDMKAASVTTPSLIVTQPVENLTFENLTVTDTATIAKSIVQETEQVTSTEDTIVLRENAVTPVPARGSGVIINNYDGNGTPLGILADSDGTVRVGAEGGTTTTYPVLWQVGSDYYNAGEQDMDTSSPVTPQGVYTSADASYESTDSIVYYNGSYYFKYIDWYVNPKVFFSSNNVLISNGPPAVIVTDGDLIAILDTLTPIKVKYYVNAVFTTVGDKQPILTRDEEADLANGAPLVWNAAQHKAQTSATTDGNKVLKSVKNSQTGIVTYEWSSSGSGAVWRGTQAQLTTALAITDPNNEDYIPNNAMIIITDASDTYLTGEEI